MQKITPFLWFDGQAEQAAAFYTSVFNNASVTDITRYGDGMPMPKGSVMTALMQMKKIDIAALEQAQNTA